MPRFELGEFAAVADGVWVAVAEPAGVNVGLVVGADAAIVIDTGSSPAQGAAIRAAAERVAGVELAATVITHWHYDHLFGLAAFADLPSYAHASVPAWLGTPECLAAAQSLDVEPTDLASPQNLFSLAKVIDLGGLRVELVHFGPGHTDGDVVAVIPEADLVFTGDLLESSGPVDFGPDCHFKDWPAALDGVLGLVGPNTTLIPGHGPAMDRFDAFEQRAAISGLYGQAEHLVARGVKLAQAYEAGQWPFEESTVRAALPLLYKQLAGEGKLPRTQLPLV